MSRSPCTLWAVASLAGKTLPEVGRRGYCVFRKHRRADKTLSVFQGRGGDVLYKCHSCDPPYNIGDAVQLYAGIYGLDRKTAWHELRDRGYAVPGSDERYAPEPARVPTRKPVLVEPPRPRVVGEEIHNVIHLDQARFASWAAKDTGARARFAEMRGLSLSTLTANDVVDVSDGLIGFSYREPDTHVVCRVKMRPLDRKTYWIEPRPPKGESGKAIGPLYLAHQIELPRASRTYAVITEGEVDALSLKEVGFQRVVSLPDGARSGATVNLSPISFGHEVWFVASDNDDEGERAYRDLSVRAKHLGIGVARVLWSRGDLAFKDANEALRAGFGYSDFAACLSAAADRYGYAVAL